MQEKTNELYQKYLVKKLDIVFNNQSENGIKYWNNPYCIYMKKINISFDFYDGYKKINNGNKFNFVNTESNLISDIWYDDVHNFNEKRALVVQNGKCNFINTEGVLISKKWYDLARSFKEGYALVINEGKYNFINTNGNLISNVWYDLAYSFNDGYARIKKDGKYNFIDPKGNLITKEWYDNIKDFNNGYAFVRKNNVGWNVINKQGQLVNKEWYDSLDSFNDYGYTIVKKDGKYNLINLQGKLINNIWYKDNVDIKILNSSFYIENAKLIKCINKYIGDYQVKKLIIGYRCIKNNNKFNVKYEPIAIYGERYVLCLKNNNVILFDKTTNIYQNIGLVDTIEFDDYFIFDSKNKRVYLMYENQVYDITDYYNMNIYGKKSITITKGINIISKNDFFYHTEDEIRELLKKEKEIEQKNVEHTKLHKIKENDENEKQRIVLEQKEALYQIQRSLNRLKELEEKVGSYNKIQVDNLFIDVNNHKEINPLYIELDMLKYIDLSMVSFKNVKINGIDFRGCNINLYPQEVYQKDLSNCNFEGLYISPFMDFAGVDLRGTKFSIDTDNKTIDRGSFTFKNSVYDERTTFNGISFTNIYGEHDKKIDSNGSKK